MLTLTDKKIKHTSIRPSATHEEKNFDDNDKTPRSITAATQENKEMPYIVSIIWNMKHKKFL